VWMVPTGNGDRYRNLPALKGLNLPPLGGDVSMSGPLLTRTLLIYALTAGGSRGGPRLVAYDKSTGKELGSVDLPSTAIGTPMTYLVDGKQYIALTVDAPRQGEPGGRGGRGGRGGQGGPDGQDGPGAQGGMPELIAFSLP
jgi:glucose dehydrogenase